MSNTQFPYSDKREAIRRKQWDAGWRPFRKGGNWEWRHPSGGCISFRDSGEAEAPIPGEWLSNRTSMGQTEEKRG